jgi:hypothetical protein
MNNRNKINKLNRQIKLNFQINKICRIKILYKKKIKIVMGFK